MYLVSEMDWFEVGSLPDLPQWQRSAGIDADGTVYVPACIAGHEHIVTLCAFHDGVTVILHQEHPYIPSTWMAREYPPVRDLCEKIERRLRKEVSN